MFLRYYSYLLLATWIRKEILILWEWTAKGYTKHTNKITAKEYTVTTNILDKHGGPLSESKAIKERWDMTPQTHKEQETEIIVAEKTPPK